MDNDVLALITEMKAAASSLEADRTFEVSDALVRAFRADPAGARDAPVLPMIKLLRRKRLFPALQRTAEGYLKHVARHPMLRTYYAQALIDQGQLDAASAVVQEVLREQPAASLAAEEARGLLGRIFKQQFVLHADALPVHAEDALRVAIAFYEDARKRAVADPLWPAVNLIALLVRAQHDEIDPGLNVDPRALAREIIAKVEDARANGEPQADSPWCLATALEASLALDEDERTVAWGKRYLAAADADSFEFGSTHRQLTEIWRLHRHPTRPAGALLALLEAELLRRMTWAVVDQPLGMHNLTASGIDLQAIWGDERFESYRWMGTGIDRGKAVARIEDLSERPKGTGFVVTGRHLKKAWGDELLLVTNRHVVDDPAPASGLSPSRAIAHFTAHAGANPQDGRVAVREIVWRSEGVHAALDVCVLRLERPPSNLTPLLPADSAGLSCEPPPRSRMCVIGHPEGRNLMFSLYDNELRSIEPPLLFYQSGTLSGSSGSPVFDRDWRLVGIHHSADHDRRANRGSMIERVVAAIAASP